MGVYKRGDVWWIDFTAPNGRRVRESSGTGYRQAAQEYHDRRKARCWEEQRLGVKPEHSWKEAAIRWVKETRHKRSHDKDVAMLRWMDRYLGALMLSQVTRELIDTIGERKAAESSPANANRYLALIRSILRRARDDWEWVDHIPKIRLYRESKRRVRWITHEEALAVLRGQLGMHAAYVFVYQGQPVERCSAAAWKRACGRAGIRDFAGTICGTPGRPGMCNAAPAFRS